MNIPPNSGAESLELHTATPEEQSTDGALLGRIAHLIQQTRTVAAAQANAALTLLNWHIGHMIDVEVLREARAGYARDIVPTLSTQLTKQFGQGFNKSNLYAMIKFSQVFPGLSR